MSKTGFRLPDDLEADLARYIPWGSKQRVVEGCLRLLVAEMKEGKNDLWTRSLTAYHEARLSASQPDTSAPASSGENARLQSSAGSRQSPGRSSSSIVARKAGRLK